MLYEDIENMKASLSKFLLKVFSENYCARFSKMLLSGGGGNSMFVNAWEKPSLCFKKYRISQKALDLLKDKLCEKFDATKIPNNIPHYLLHNNAKGAKKRAKCGKKLHIDHNPSNKKVLDLIKKEVIRLNAGNISESEKLELLKGYISNIQTLDIITVEQDDLRTLKDMHYSKKDKDFMSAEQRDGLIDDKIMYCEDIE